MELPENIQTLLALKKKDPNHTELTNVFRTILQLMGKQDWRGIDFILKSSNPGEISITAMLALARGTSSAKEKLLQWYPFVRAVEMELMFRGEDAQHMLRGLI